jgi:hypothetical protein
MNPRTATALAFCALGAAFGCKRADAPGAATERATALPMAPAPVPAAPADAGAFEVTLANGKVEAQRDGNWVPIAKGDRLTRADVVRTAAGSTAVLKLDVGTEIELRAGVEIGLDRLPGGASVDLRRGKVLARVGPTEALAITTPKTRTTNEGPSRFVVQSDDKGRVSVAALEGSARFAAGGKTVKLPAGTVSASAGDGPPEDPERIPEDVLLSVVWPTGERHGDTAEIAGRAAPSTMVSVNGTLAPVGPDGRFTATVKLREGKNPIDVTAEDLSGRTRRDSSTIVRQTPQPPLLKPEATDLWKK